ncbi:MAG: hypothetical protein QOI61_2593, partial [Actinomycetota bacterium]
VIDRDRILGRSKVEVLDGPDSIRYPNGVGTAVSYELPVRFGRPGRHSEVTGSRRLLGD